jgi:hypothetical protein
MTSPTLSKDTQSAIATPLPVATVVAPQTPANRIDAKDGPQGSLPLGRGVVNGQVAAPRPSAPTEAPKSVGPAPKSAHTGGSGLRQAVQELASSVACLANERMDAAGARTHLEAANRFLGGLSQGGEKPEAPQNRPTDPAVPAVRVGGSEDVKDGPRASR